ncbi:hypothetical protein B0H12DRAFT_1080513 [Mycena haematopus]|nr:hypothetical protein B0H12DRAFT_1080513 [Mycena haematopus]
MSRKATCKRGRRVVAVSDDEDEPMVGSSTGIVGSSTGAAATEEVPRRPIKRQRAHDDGEISPAKVSTGPSTVGDCREEIAADGTAVNEDEKFGALAPKQRTRFQGASVRMNKAREHFPTIQKAVLSSFTPKDLGDACSCGAEATYRCTDCFKSPMNCQKCIVQSHEHTPFHRIESWNGKHFARTSLHAAGMILHMCFKATNGASCPHNSSRFRKRQVMTLGEESGFHDVEIEYCSCQSSDAVDQLLAVNLLPSSFSSVQTVFTWTVMKCFHIHCLASKKSAYDYVKALCKLTDNAAYSQVTDRYREFQFGYRIWRFLALERRTGQAHGIDKFVPHRRPGSLTVRCPACPEVGFNVDEETINNADESEKEKNKRDDPDDVALNAGAGYFVETEEYKRYFALAKPVDDPNTCSQFEAACMQNIAKFKNAVISGVVAVQNGGPYERFAKTDYVLAYALGEASLIRWIMATYDIWCQYSIKLKERFGDWFPSMLDIMNKIRGAIPKMHIHGHMLLCLILWNLIFIRWSGFTVGELIETSWVEQNLTAGSTREQNDGNRHDSVDDTSGNWNWDKMVGLAQTLQRLYRIAKAELVKRSENFDAVNAKHPDTLIAEWEAMDPVSKMVPEDPEDKTTRRCTGPPTHAEAYAKLLNEELDKVSDITASSVSDRKAGDSVLITVALMLEKDQLRWLNRIVRLMLTLPKALRSADDCEACGGGPHYCGANTKAQNFLKTLHSRGYECSWDEARRGLAERYKAGHVPYGIGKARRWRHTMDDARGHLRHARLLGDSATMREVDTRETARRARSSPESEDAKCVASAEKWIPGTNTTRPCSCRGETGARKKPGKKERTNDDVDEELGRTRTAVREALHSAPWSVEQDKEPQ